MPISYGKSNLRIKYTRCSRSWPVVRIVTWSSVSPLILGASWLALVIGSVTRTFHLSLIDLLLALALLVIVPLGLHLARPRGHAARTWFTVGRRLVWVGAIASAASLIATQGVVAGVLAASWLAGTGTIGLAWLFEFLRSRRPTVGDLLPAASAAYLVFAAGWLVVSRLGWRPLGFSDVIVELTSVHFHYGGFAALVVAASARNFLHSRSVFAGRAATAAGIGILVAMALVAAGFSVSPLVQVVGAAMLAVSLTVLSIATLLGAVPHLRSTPVRVLLVISALSGPGGIALGLQYVVAKIIATPALTIQQMAAVHGVLNAFGFSLCGLIGWTFANRADLR